MLLIVAILNILTHSTENLIGVAVERVVAAVVRRMPYLKRAVSAGRIVSCAGSADDNEIVAQLASAVVGLGHGTIERCQENIRPQRACSPRTCR